MTRLVSSCRYKIPENPTNPFVFNFAVSPIMSADERLMGTEPRQVNALTLGPRQKP
jgi:hypothetical protein